MTASPVGSSGVSGPVDGRSVAEIRADLARRARGGLGEVHAYVRRLVADVPALLAEVEAAHRFEESAAAESAGLANLLNDVAAERDELRGEVERLRRVADLAAKVMATLAEYGPGIVGHLLDNDANDGERLRVALAAAADAPQPEPITYGPRVPSRRVDLGEWDSHRPDFLPDSSSSPVQPADPPTKETDRE